MSAPTSLAQHTAESADAANWVEAVGTCTVAEFVATILDYVADGTLTRREGERACERVAAGCGAALALSNALRFATRWADEVYAERQYALTCVVSAVGTIARIVANHYGEDIPTDVQGDRLVIHGSRPHDGNALTSAAAYREAADLMLQGQAADEWGTFHYYYSAENAGRRGLPALPADLIELAAGARACWDVVVASHAADARERRMPGVPNGHPDSYTGLSR